MKKANPAPTAAAMIESALQGQCRLGPARTAIDSARTPIGPHPFHPPGINRYVVVTRADAGGGSVKRQVAMATSEIYQPVDRQGFDTSVLVGH